ncbi:MAG TPA: RNA polymerase sigma factor [Thermoanaerobaculia bacterium]|nr:RNA polymerase sigma factor [Thermoanaerobaculia bacterium]
MTDARLERFADGDLAAFESLFREFQGEVYGWIVRMVRDRGAAEELTVETFLRIYNARARFDAGRSFPAWARRIASNLALSYLKSHPARPETPVEPPGEAPEDPAIRRETRESIATAFRALPAKLQAVASLALIEQQSYDDIADGLGISVGAVKSRVFRAVRILRTKLKRMGIQP